MAEAVERTFGFKINDNHVGDLIVDLKTGLTVFSPTNVATKISSDEIKLISDVDVFSINLGDIKMDGFGNQIFSLQKQQ